MLLTEKEARAIADRMLSFVKADDAMLNINSERLAHLRFAVNNFLTSGVRDNRGASVTVWIGGKRGAASTNDTDDASLREAVEQAESIARIAPVDREYLPTLGRQTYKPVNGYTEATANISASARARAVGAILAQSERAKVITAGFHQARTQAAAFATKNGNFAFERRTVVGLSVSSRTTDGASSGFFQRNHFDVGKLDTERIAREAIRRALEGRGARSLDASAYTVVLEPQAVADLVGSMTFDARSAEEGRSPYSVPGGKTRLGERIFDERINIYSDPWNAELPGTQAAQAGLPAERIHLVKNGALENLTYTRFWARQRMKEPTPGPVNFILETASARSSIEEMIRSTRRGLLISRFWYIRSTDPRTASLTGLTRDGVWYIEGGEIRYPVKNFRFNQSVIGMLAPGNVEMIGTSERVGDSDSAALLPALKLKAFNFTSQSEAV
jgi:predicted Zn-dependent protease